MGREADFFLRASFVVMFLLIFFSTEIKQPVPSNSLNFTVNNYNELLH